MPRVAVVIPNSNGKHWLGPRLSFPSGYCRLFPASVQVNGDGLAIRDFSSVKDVVQADQRVALLQSAVAGQVFNIGSGQRTTLLILLAELPNCAARCARRSGPCNAASG